MKQLEFFQQKLVRERLLQSQQRHLMHQEQASGVRSPRTQERSQNSSNTHRNTYKPNVSASSSGRRPSMNSQLEKLTVKVNEAKKEEEKINNSRNESQVKNSF